MHEVIESLVMQFILHGKKDVHSMAGTSISDMTCGLKPLTNVELIFHFMLIAVVLMMKLCLGHILIIMFHTNFWLEKIKKLIKHKPQEIVKRVALAVA